uniref:Uncharacterized protein n=1 Tax=Rhizophora mucronata TaxID=61149 RepID=A0A2P2NY14_RHIMU
MSVRICHVKCIIDASVPTGKEENFS